MNQNLDLSIFSEGVNPRQLKAILAVVEMKSVSAAARSLGRSQPSVTKSIRKIESTISEPLFERSTGGMKPTVFGMAFYNRVRSLRQILVMCHEKYCSTVRNPTPIGQIPLFTMDVSLSRMIMLPVLQRSRSISACAGVMKITKRAIYSFVNELEGQLQVELFYRDETGQLVPTSLCHYFSNKLALFLRELEFARQDISNLVGKMVGRVIVGSLPASAAELVPRALSRLGSKYPNVDIESRMGSIDKLLDGLRSGELDLIVTGTRSLTHAFESFAFDEADFEVRHLYLDMLQIVVASDHPLASAETIKLEQLSDCQWVMMPKSLPAGKLIHEILADAGIMLNANKIGSHSVTLLRNLVVNGGFVGVITGQQALLDLQAGILKVLDIDLASGAWPVGVVLRRNSQLSPAALSCLEELVEVAEELSALEKH